MIIPFCDQVSCKHKECAYEDEPENKWFCCDTECPFDEWTKQVWQKNAGHEIDGILEG